VRAGKIALIRHQRYAHAKQFKRLVLRPGDPIVVRATGAARFMFFGGAPMEGPRYIWWNFVSSRPERIEQAKEERARGRFDTVPGDAEEFIPLPRTTDKPRRATGGVYYP
jgi:redox-sensitive bicupin YhaK (pirin superfamily)